MLFYQTPDTTSGLIFGYAASALIFGLYIATLVIRHSSLRRDVDVIEQADEDE